MWNLTPSETRTILFISGILILSGLFYLLGSYVEKPISIDYSESDSIFSRLSHQRIPTNHVIDNDNQETHSIDHDISHRSPATPKAAKGSIDINVANVSELKKLPRIGPAMANRIIEYRRQNGPFKSMDELTNVKGIGKKTFNLIKPYLRDID